MEFNKSLPQSGEMQAAEPPGLTKVLCEAPAQAE
jgi:hypothetical protein